MAPPPLPFTLLTEDSTNTTMTVPAGFDPMTAWLLAQCCALTYQQYDTATPPDLSRLTLTGATITPGTPQVLTVSEANGPEASPDYPGSYTTLPVGFAVAISQTGVSSKSSLPSRFIVVAIRGTQTWDEWVDDAEAYPTLYPGTPNGLVHGGIYDLYTIGTDGATVENPLSTNPADRAAGSIAAQIATVLTNNSLPANLPLFVTGHSLGGALAAYCALDIALNFPTAVQCVSMYSLAAPREVMGLQFEQSDFFDFPTGNFLNTYQAKVPNSFRIVQACDIVPILPGTTVISTSLITITAAQVTDPYTYEGNNYNGLPGNVVSFCAQAGDIGDNHSCLTTYLPYTAWLAAAWLAQQAG